MGAFAARRGAAPWIGGARCAVSPRLGWYPSTTSILHDLTFDTLLSTSSNSNVHTTPIPQYTPPSQTIMPVQSQLQVSGQVQAKRLRFMSMVRDLMKILKAPVSSAMVSR